MRSGKLLLLVAMIPSSLLSGCKSSREASSTVSANIELSARDDRFALESLQATYQPDFQRVVVFGDSLSDQTNLKRITLGLVPNATYFQGRFSNGPVWVEYLEKGLNIPVLNLATGAATATFEARQLVIPNVFPGMKGLPLPTSFPRSINNSVNDHIKSKDFKPKGTLYVIWGGINDLFAGISDSDRISGSIKTDVENVIKAGGKRFLVPMMLSVEGLPRNLPNGSIKRPDDATLLPLINTFNARLLSDMEEVERLNPEVKITIAMTTPLLQLIQSRPELLGLSNTRDACYIGDFIAGTGGQDKVCKDSFAYAFWDKVHPSTKLHCALAINFLDALQQDQQFKGPTLDVPLTLSKCSSISGSFGS